MEGHRQTEVMDKSQGKALEGIYIIVRDCQQRGSEGSRQGI